MLIMFIQSVLCGMYSVYSMGARAFFPCFAVNTQDAIADDCQRMAGAVLPALKAAEEHHGHAKE